MVQCAEMIRIQKKLPGLLFLLPAALFFTQCAPKPFAEPVPAACLPAEFCYVDELIPSIRTDLKYAGNDNFVGRRIAGYTGHRAMLRKDAALALRKAADSLAKKGYGLLVWDAYRPACAMRDFRAWSRNNDNRMQARFYPNITKKGIYDGKYIGEISEHCWGIALDLTLVDLSTGKEIDMGGHHDLLDPSSATDSTAVTPRQRANRHILRDAMLAAGFENYDKEWWHYRLSNSKPWYVYNFSLSDNLPPAPAAAR